MTKQMTEWMNLLELKPGADAEAVKKAYFRLVRKYSPEKNPDMFKKIRAAYEGLKDGIPEDDKDDESTVSLSHVENSFTQIIMEEFHAMMNRGAYKDAVKLMEQASAYYPADQLMRYRCGEAQLFAGNSGKAVKTAEKLLEEIPDSLICIRLAANACHERGYHKKAIGHFSRGFELGLRDRNWLIVYIDSMVKADDFSMVGDVCFSILENTKAANADELNQITWIFSILRKEKYKWDLEDTKKYYDALDDFLDSNKKMIADGAVTKDVMNNMIISLGGRLYETEEYKIYYQRAASAIEKLAGISSKWKSCVLEFKTDLIETTLNSYGHEHYNEAWSELASVPYKCRDQDEDIIRYATLDCKLMLIKEREETAREAELIRDNFIDFYNSQREFIDGLISGDILKEYDGMLKEYRKLSQYCMGGLFESAYPKEMVEMEEGAHWKYNDGDTYTKDKPAVGRNDPCPCGSGKKFKKCCMGKGIYD